MPATHHILVVDDEDLVRFAVSQLLQSRGYQVSLAETSEQALKALTQLPINLVVLDVELGNENGLDLLNKIKKAHPGLRVVILTGRGYEEALWQTARDHGADGYISKTLPPNQLVMEVNRWLRHAGKRRDDSPSPSPAL